MNKKRRIYLFTAVDTFFLPAAFDAVALEDAEVVFLIAAAGALVNEDSSWLVVVVEGRELLLLLPPTVPLVVSMDESGSTVVEVVLAPVVDAISISVLYLVYLSHWIGISWFLFILMCLLSENI